MALDFKQNEPLKNHSTFRIGGPARYFVAVENKEEILEAIGFAKEKSLPYVVIGSGSNILFRDEGFDGVVIKMGPHPFTPLLQGEGPGVRLIIPAGVLLSQVLSFATESGLSGLEWAIGIPGTIGGAVVDNTGAFGRAMSESIVRVKTLDREYNKEQCEFKYRDSKFKNLDNKEIITEIELELQPSNKEKIKETISNNMAQRKGRIPPHPSIGCIFKNPKPLSAGKLIEECGLKGQRVGNAQISELHADIIVNLGNASAKDVLELIELCKQKVREKFNLDLENEIVII